jgi:hypothetical protein
VGNQSRSLWAADGGCPSSRNRQLITQGLHKPVVTDCLFFVACIEVEERVG